MPTRVYSEDGIKKRKLLSGDEKPTRKYTKTIKQEIKKEPLDMSDDDINDDDVMDIEEADGTLPKKGKMNPKQKRVVKTKKIKKVPKVEKDKEPKDAIKVKPKRKKKLPPPVALAATPTAEVVPLVKPAPTPEPSKPVKKVSTKITKEKKIKPPKPPKRDKKPEKMESKTANNSDSDSSPEESDAYETCGVKHCQRPSGKMARTVWFVDFYSNFLVFSFRICSRLDPLRWRL